MNNYKNFITYFKRSDSIASTGLGLLATGGILLLLGWWFFWLLFYIAVIMIPIGLVIYIYGTSGSADVYAPGGEPGQYRPSAEAAPGEKTGQKKENPACGDCRNSGPCAAGHAARRK